MQMGRDKELFPLPAIGGVYLAKVAIFQLDGQSLRDY